MRRASIRSFLLCCIAIKTAVLGLDVPIANCAGFNDAASAELAPSDDLRFDSADNQFGLTGTAEEAATSYGSQRFDISEIWRQERLIDRVTDPTAWLMDFRFRQQWNWPLEATDPDTQAIEFRPTIPFMAWDQVNILRVAVPYDLRGSNGARLGDIQLFDLVVFEASWGRWGIGPSVRLTPNSDSEQETFQAGPAAGAVMKNKHWTIGVLTQTFLSDGDSETRLQPILAYKFDEQWAVAIGESEFRYDWEDAIWTQLPFGVELDYIADIHGQKIQFFVNPQYNFQRDSSNSGWTLFLGVVLLVPEA